MLGMPGMILSYNIDIRENQWHYFKRFLKCSTLHNALWHLGVVMFTVFLIWLWVFLAKIVIHYEG